MRAIDYIVQDRLEEEFDKTVLHRPLFPVNMRLFSTSQQYRQLILQVADYMTWILGQKPEDYSQPGGISGANLGIPWNIIGVRHKQESVVYLNPCITAWSETQVKTMSNCGSLRLPQMVEVWRREWIDLEWYDLEGVLQQKKHITRKDQGFTIQHEVDHNLGIMIDDSRVCVGVQS